MPRVEPRTYLHILSCAAAAGGYFAVGVVALVLFLNPHLPATPGVLAHMVVFLIPVYGLAATGLLAAAAMALQPFALAPIARRHLDPVLTARFLLGVLALWSGLFWGNARVADALLSPRQERHLLRGALVITTAFALGLCAHAVQRLFPRRRHVARACLLLLAISTPWGLFTQRRVSHTPLRRHTLVLDIEAARVPMRILAIDGLSLDDLRPLDAQGLVPNFGRILAEGTSGRLRASSPTTPTVAWTTLATGKLPFRHGIADDEMAYLAGSEDPLRVLPRYLFFRSLRHLSILSATPALRTDRQCMAFWNVMTRGRVSVGVINWPVTFPAERTLRLMITDYLTRPYFQYGTALARVTHPEQLQALALRYRSAPEDVPDALVESLVPSPRPEEEEELVEKLRTARAQDSTIRSLALLFSGRDGPEVLAIRMQGLELVYRYFMRYHRPDAFGDVPSAVQARLGRVVASHYAYLDGVVGELMAGLPDGGILVVCSGYGIAPLSSVERLLRRSRGSLVTGTREGGVDGTLLLWGKPVARGVSLERRELVDVTPTLLYAQGLPAARDMDGSPIFEAFTDDYVSRHPLSTIESYEAARIAPLMAAPRPTTIEH